MKDQGGRNEKQEYTETLDSLRGKCFSVVNFPEVMAESMLKNLSDEVVWPVACGFP